VKTDVIRRAWERYLVDGDAVALLTAVREQRCGPLPGAEYPELHRICDIDLCGRAYRVLRYVDRAGGDPELFLVPTDVPGLDQPGVPYWLQGNALIQWIHDEIERPAEDQVDWEQYRDRFAPPDARRRLLAGTDSEHSIE
jgi:hypothetical protein